MNNINGIKIEDGEIKVNKGVEGGNTVSTSTTVFPSPSLSPSPSSYKTCEEYVLASLETYKKKAALVDSYASTLATLKEIFFVVATPGGINIGVHDELLDIGHDSAAVARIMLLKTLFETTAAPVEESVKTEDTRSTEDSNKDNKDGDPDRSNKSNSLDLSDYKAYTVESAEEVEALNLAEAYKDAIYNESDNELDLGSTKNAGGG